MLDLRESNRLMLIPGERVYFAVGLDRRTSTLCGNQLLSCPPIIPILYPGLKNLKFWDFLSDFVGQSHRKAQVCPN